MTGAIGLQVAPAPQRPSILVFNVKNYGAKGDGTTDDFPSVQNAINAAQTWLGTGNALWQFFSVTNPAAAVVYSPPGGYRMASGTATITALGVTMEGAGERATIYTVDHNSPFGPIAILPAGGLEIDGVAVRRIGLYQSCEQVVINHVGGYPAGTPITTITVQPLAQALPNGTIVQIPNVAGNGTADAVTINAVAAAGATSISFASFSPTHSGWANGAVGLVGALPQYALTFTGGPTGGTFTLFYGPNNTGAIPYSAGLTAATVQTMVRAMPNATVAAVSGPAGGPFTITNFDSGGTLTETNALTGGSSPNLVVSIAQTAGLVIGGPTSITTPNFSTVEDVWALQFGMGFKLQDTGGLTLQRCKVLAFDMTWNLTQIDGVEIVDSPNQNASLHCDNVIVAMYNASSAGFAPSGTTQTSYAWYVTATDPLTGATGGTMLDHYFAFCEADGTTYGIFLEGSGCLLGRDIHLIQPVCDTNKWPIWIENFNTTAPTPAIDIDSPWIQVSVANGVGITVSNGNGVSIRGGQFGSSVAPASGATWGIALSNARDCTITGNLFAGPFQFAINVVNASFFNTITANVLVFTSTANPAGYAGIHINAGGGNTVVGNTIRGQAAGFTLANGILLDGATNQNILVANVVDGATVTTPYNPASATQTLHVANSFDSQPGLFDVQVFLAAGGAFTWTKPAGAKMVKVILLGGGGGGGSGAHNLSTGVAGGGGGGGPAGYVEGWCQASDLAATVSGSVGTGGLGAGGVTTNGSGNAGGAGGNTWFGSASIGSAIFAAGGGPGGGPGTTTTGGTGGQGAVDYTVSVLDLSSFANTGSGGNGTTASSGSASNGTGNNYTAGGGGGGAGTSTGTSNGGNGGIPSAQRGLTAAAGGTGNGGNGTNGSTLGSFSGSGGGGGAGHGSGGGNAGNGGNGGPGSGGGGGGGDIGSGASGNGGGGGNGIAAVLTYGN